MDDMKLPKENTYHYEMYRGAEVKKYIPLLAQKRLKMFAEPPYLYEGDQETEEVYLKNFANSENSMMFMSKIGETVVGLLTAIPLAEEVSIVNKNFEGRYDLAKIFYIKETIVEPEHRKTSIALSLYGRFEKEIKALGGYDYLTFCAIKRDEETNAQYSKADLAAVAEKNGYKKDSEIDTDIEWKEIGKTEPVKHTMEFWLKKL